MKHVKEILALSLVVMALLTVFAPTMALSGGYDAASVYLSTSTMKQEWVNNTTAVKNLQRMLHALNFYTGAIDGDYGPLTYDAVWAFQYTYGLSTDGQCGRFTKTKIWEVLTVLPAGCTPC